MIDEKTHFHILYHYVSIFIYFFRYSQYKNHPQTHGLMDPPATKSTGICRSNLEPRLATLRPWRRTRIWCCRCWQRRCCCGIGEPHNHPAGWNQTTEENSGVRWLPWVQKVAIFVICLFTYFTYNLGTMMFNRHGKKTLTDSQVWHNF